MARRCLPIALLITAAGTPAQGQGAPGEAQPHTVVRASLEASGYHDTDHVDVATPTVAASISDPVAGWSVGGSYLVDAVSAASVDIVSSATPHWTELRHVGAGTVHYKPHDFGIDLGGGVSREPDYLSLAGGGSLSLDLFEKNVTAVLGLSYADETAGRSGTPFASYSLHLTKVAPRAGLTIILNPSAVLDLVTEASLERGDQSKPYRYVPLFAPAVAPQIGVGASGDEVNARRVDLKPEEKLPLARNRYALTARLSQRFAASALRLEERLYSDDWGLRATTTDLRYIVDLSRRVFAWPHLRVHLQTPVAFWQRAYEIRVGPAGLPAEPPPPIRTGDRELGPLRSVTAGGGLRFNLDGDRSTWSITLQGDVVFTTYLDALYIKDRMAFFGALGLEATLD